MKRWLLIGIPILMLVIVLVAYGQYTSAVRVESARAQRDVIQEFIDETAKTRLPEIHLITMPFAGRIEPISLVEGTPVRKGSVVARIVPKDMDLAVKAAKATVGRLDAAISENAFDKIERTAHQQTLSFVDSMKSTVQAAAERVRSGEAKLNYARNHLERILRLRTSNSATQDDEDRARLLLVESEVELQQDRLIHSAAKAMLAATSLTPLVVLQYIERKGYTGDALKKEREEAQVKLELIERDQTRANMTSPVDGVVLERVESNERYLEAGTVLVKIGELDRLEIESEVLSQDVVSVKPGHRAEVYGPAVGATPVPVTVQRIHPAGFTKVSSLGVEQQRVKVILGFDSQSLGRLRAERQLGADYRVRVRIFTAGKPDAVVIPRSALFRSPAGTWQVFAIQSGRAALVDVQVGLMNDERVEIALGLEAGDEVVLAPETSLDEGSRVWSRGTE